MMIILAVLVIIFFVVGSALILQGFFETPEAATIVALQDFDQLKKELSNSAAAQGQLTSQLDKLTLEMNQAKDDLQKARREAEAGEILRRENAVLEERLRRTEENLHILRSEADRQARGAVEAITHLQGENRQLAAEVKHSAGKVPAEELEKIAAEKKVLQVLIEEQSGRIKNLEAEAARQQMDSEQKFQTIQADSQIWQRDRLCLTEGVRALISRLGEVSVAVAQMKSAYNLRWEESAQAVAALKEENAVLLEQAQRVTQLRHDLEAAQISLQERERAFVLTRQQSEADQQRIVRLNSEIDALNAQLAGMMEERLRIEARTQNPPKEKGAGGAVLAELEDLRQQLASLQEYCVLIQEEMVKYRVKAELLDISYQEVLGEYEKITGAGTTS